ncbi:hypothetical protein ACQKP7_29695, partial [Pseudomonas frederiksbergensis]|uniref:hypothetical protein n=1 Tax=Pseudomonas frederiksbergensis TaxID=104087 RepID=UPI003D0887FF
LLASAPVVVLAGAAEIKRFAQSADLPLKRIRGFQLLYDPVANGLVDVANSLPQCKRIDNFSVVFQALSTGKKSPW